MPLNKPFSTPSVLINCTKHSPLQLYGLRPPWRSRICITDLTRSKICRAGDCMKPANAPAMVICPYDSDCVSLMPLRSLIHRTAKPYPEKEKA